jgi:hypothetical protein
MACYGSSPPTRLPSSVPGGSNEVVLGRYERRQWAFYASLAKGENHGQTPQRVQWLPASVRQYVAAQTQKPMRQYAAFEIHTACVFDELVEAFSVGCERRIVFAPARSCLAIVRASSQRDAP